MTIAYDDVKGHPTFIDLDGEESISISYDSSTGQVSGVTASGATIAYGYHDFLPRVPLGAVGGTGQRSSTTTPTTLHSTRSSTTELPSPTTATTRTASSRVWSCRRGRAGMTSLETARTERWRERLSAA